MIICRFRLCRSLTSFEMTKKGSAFIVIMRALARNNLPLSFVQISHFVRDDKVNITFVQ